MRAPVDSSTHVSAFARGGARNSFATCAGSPSPPGCSVTRVVLAHDGPAVGVTAPHVGERALPGGALRDVDGSPHALAPLLRFPEHAEEGRVQRRDPRPDVTEATN